MLAHTRTNLYKCEIINTLSHYKHIYLEHTIIVNKKIGNEHSWFSSFENIVSIFHQLKHVLREILLSRRNLEQYYITIDGMEVALT